MMKTSNNTRHYSVFAEILAFVIYAFCIEIGNQIFILPENLLQVIHVYLY